MAERSFRHLSPPATELLINGNYYPALMRGLQLELQAYFPYNQDTFGGVLYHRDGKGPEKPYLKPEGSDYQPEVQAIARIGVQYYYWDMLHSSLEQGRIYPVQMISMSILVLCMNSDDSSYVEIDSYPSILEHVAQELGDEAIRYPGCVIPTNY